ncbi:SMC-Scp complex subunit ScpB [Atopobiaceae bacterium 24-176]
MNENLDRLPADSQKGCVEALLLVSSDPLPATTVAKVLGITPGEAVEALSDLSAEYQDANRGIQLRQVAGGWRLFTHPAYHDQVERLVASWDTRRLSQAALETLAVIAYHQPVSREGVKAVRGVNSEGVISSLIEKGLVREAGRDKDRGHAVLYGTTTAFLERFGLASIKALPPLEDFAPDEASRQFIIERLGGRGTAAAVSGEVDDEAEEELSLEELELADGGGDVLDNIDMALLEVGDDDDE